MGFDDITKKIRRDMRRMRGSVKQMRGSVNQMRGSVKQMRGSVKQSGQLKWVWERGVRLEAARMFGADFTEPLTVSILDDVVKLVQQKGKKKMNKEKIMQRNT